MLSAVHDRSKAYGEPFNLIVRLTSLAWSDQRHALATNSKVSIHSCHVLPSPLLLSPEKLGMGRTWWARRAASRKAPWSVGVTDVAIVVYLLCLGYWLQVWMVG